VPQQVVPGLHKDGKQDCFYHGKRGLTLSSHKKIMRIEKNALIPEVELFYK